MMLNNLLESKYEKWKKTTSYGMDKPFSIQVGQVLYGKKMVNGLNLYTALSSPQRQRPQTLYTTISHSPIYTLVSYNMATAAMGRTDRSEAAINRRNQAL
ncbi:hypothetical protein CHARACLAT_027349 [Characodon lateralis]|uniref:Uncharacterized protein n=1 Tax=Characodon lateralis TaxID=208331 RepID=A0ABU7CS78_9TELE|nr:hypothetical protein [Characodon lateralis]